MSRDEGRFAEGAPVQARYPAGGRESAAERESWPWMDATVAAQCGPDEWLVTIEDRRVTELDDGTPAPEGTPEEELLFPQCFRDASEIRELRPGEPGWAALYAATHRVLCTHADQDGRGAHWLESGENCTAPEAIRGSQMEAGQ